MSRKTESIPYHCTFCRERLVKADRCRIDYLWLFVLFRPFRCPHCFMCVSRPMAWIGRLWPVRAVISFIPKKLSPGRTRRSSGKFLKPSGNPSRRRSRNKSDMDKTPVPRDQQA
ncbi:MAG TPA: hypothetical protein EYG03_17425 [Planctomycetes bacterium]|nr:hypothetical protein [Planctomycetota bacterium]